MKKRYMDIGRLRKMKKIKLTEKISESAYSVLKFMIVWMMVLLADFVLEFRLEYLWPCWLFLGTVYTTFHCHGLAICVVFVCAAFTLDLFCLVFVPLHWLFFAASTYVLLNYMWHTEKGICMSTVTLWILLVYMEASLRLKELKSPYANLSHLFAAHCIGYPLVYMGFDATCYFSSMFKLRTQKSAHSENDLHMDLLQQSLPPYMHLYPKLWMEDSKYKMSKSRPTQYQCPPDTTTSEDKHNMEDCLQIHRLPSRPEKDLNPQTPASKHRGGEIHLDSTSILEMTENLPQDDQSSKALRSSKSSLPKVQRSSVNVPNGKAEKRQKNLKAINSTGESVERCSSNIPTHNPPPNPSNPHAEQMLKLEQELRKLKGELQASRQSEQELRSHICNLTNSEHSLRPEVSLLRHANELLQNKIQCLSKSRQKDKQNCSLLEKKIRMETDARVVVEKQLTEVRAQKFDEATILLRSASHRQEQSETQMLRKKAKDLDSEYKQLQLEYQGKENRMIALENEVETLQRNRCSEQEADALLSALSSLQDKAQHLEYNLSAETRLKLDLFSALGDARRQLEIAQVKILKQDHEVKEMKQKLAEAMAVAPGMSYMAPRSSMPQYLKFLNSERYMLNPRALMYQCLKK
ncbi:macoilin isoform X2 [Danio rerio]|uniref:Macoilin isoform X2 n=2 Tax=Danio rerio TaxID=7955 RepID=A0A8M2B7G7_DANRE|nr:macoilin isoform X2 [Danio rerio]XP_021329040.1 macoilin isoform X2 [Danio rerio]|eukprot:XP_005160660.1 macoilin isoform X2 [Danio rerio]